MKNLKKIILVALSLVIVLSLLCSCGEEENQETVIKATPKPTPENLISQVRLSGYTYFDKASNLEDFYMTFNKEYPGVEVTIYRDDVTTEVYFDAVDAMIENGNLDELGDVVLLDSSRMAKLAHEGKLLNLSEYVGSVLNFDDFSPIDPESDLLPAAYNASLYDGQLYMVAVEYNHKFVFLNVSMLEENGYSFPNDDWTWEDLVTIAEDLKTKGIQKPIAMDYTDYAVWGAFARSYGQDIYDYIGNSDSVKELCLTNPEVVKGLEDMADIVDPARGIVDAVNSKDINAEDLAKYAFVIADHEDIAYWNEYLTGENCGFNWDYIHFPRWNDADFETNGKYYQSIGSEVYGFAVIDHGESETYNDEFYRTCAYMALQASVTSASKAYCLKGEAVPANKEANSFKFWREYPEEGKNSSVFSNFADTADYAASLSCFMPIMSENEIDITYAVEGYLSGERTMVESLQQLQDKAIASWIE